MDEDIKRALKMAKEKYGDVGSAYVGESDKYKLITIDNPNSDDGFDAYWLLINKETSNELLGSGIILDPIEGFEDFSYNDL